MGGGGEFYGFSKKLLPQLPAYREKKYIVHSKQLNIQYVNML